MKKTQRHSDLPESTIKEIVSNYGEIAGINRRSFLSICPKCGSEKFYIDRKNGRSVCFKASCDYGKGVTLPRWLSIVIGIEYEAAVERIYGDRQVSANEKFPTGLIDHDDIEELSDLEEIEYPNPAFFNLDSPLASDAIAYVEKRGIPLSVAMEMGFSYKMDDRRLVMPIFLDGLCCGWQGRAIDKVDDKYRVRNSIGFPRGRLVMFQQTITSGDYFVVAEGPFDALKFYKAKHFVATLGKNVTDPQLDLMCESPARFVFVGLDDDAKSEALDLCERLRYNGKTPLLISVPDSAIKRCDQLGKKADFGECTFDECLESLKQAKRPPTFQVIRDI